MHLDLFKELAKTIKLPYKLNSYAAFNDQKIERMTTLDCKIILEQNALPFRDNEEDFVIGKNIIPKDGYSDNLRVLNFVKAHVEEQFRSAITAPCLKGQNWEELPFEAAYLFRSAFEAHSGGTPLKVKPSNKPEDLDLWNGVFLGHLQDYEDEDGFMAVPLPKAKEYYINFSLKPREAKAFMDAQPDQGQWAVLPCELDCERSKHVHVVSGRYLARWNIQQKDGTTTTIKLAPPLSAAKLGKVDLKVNKNCVLNQIVKTTKAFQGTLLENGAERLPQRVPQGGLPEPDADDDGNEFMTSVYQTAYEACCALAAKGDYGDLQTVVRNTKNLKWRQLDKVVSTASQLTKLKKELSSAFTSNILPLAQQTGGTDIKTILTQCTKVAAKWGAVRKDNILGYLVSRLAEPIHNISSVDGRVVVVSPDELGAGGATAAGGWGDL